MNICDELHKILSNNSKLIKQLEMKEDEMDELTYSRNLCGTVCKMCEKKRTDMNVVLNCGCMGLYCGVCLNDIRENIKNDCVWQCLSCDGYVSEIIYLNQ